MALRLDVRRLAAIDLWGSAGVQWRRWVILSEFLLAVLGGGAIGVVLIPSGGVARPVIGWVVVGVAANYLPLSLHALTLVRPGALEAEIEGVDVYAELRHYTTAQFWVVVPLLFVVFAVAQWRRPRT